MLNPRDLRTWWAGDRNGWMVEADIPLSRSMIAQVAAYTLRVQKQRLAGLPPGDRRNECERTIDALETGRVYQNFTGVGEKVLFDAYKSSKVTLDMGDKS